MKLSIFTLTFLLIFSANSYGQFAEETGDLRGFGMGFHASSRGFGSDFRYIYGTPQRDWVFGLRAFGVKDARETKIESQFQDRGSRYVFGKLNRLMVVSPYAGIYKELVPRRSGSFVSLKGSFQVGPALGLLRPYYLDIFVPSPVYQQLGTPEPQPYDPDSHAYVDIVGVSSLFSAGFGKVNLRPGLSFRATTMVNFAQKDTYINAIELGANLNYFFSEVPIMAEVENHRFFLAISLGMVFGNSWTTTSEEK
jgi:hypothetical protein